MLGLIAITSVHAQDVGLEANLRYRRLGVPDGIVDVWFYDKEGGAPFERPQVSGKAIGVEVVMRPGTANWIFYLERISSGMEEGYWDDVENGEPIDHDDGDWVRPDKIGGWGLGANLMHEQRFTPKASPVGFSLLFGGGLGMGLTTGSLTTWQDGTNPENTDTSCLPKGQAWERVDVCPDDGDKRVPGIVPLLDLGIAPKVYFADTAHLRLDLGLHSLFMWGISAGASF